MTTCPSCNQLRQTFINTPKGMVCSQCFSMANPSDPIAMTLRDWFAGMAMKGMVGATTERGDKMWDEKLVAKYSYGAADAMLAERDKTKL